MRMPRSRRGFTLVEALISATLFILIGGAAFLLATTVRRVWVRTDARLASFSQAQQALTRLVEDVREASMASLSCGVPSTLSLNRQGTAITYDMNNGRLRRNGQAVAGGLTGFTVACGPPELDGLVVIEVATQTPSLEGPFTATLRSRAWARQP